VDVAGLIAVGGAAASQALILLGLLLRLSRVRQAREYERHRRLAAVVRALPDGGRIEERRRDGSRLILSTSSGDERDSAGD
jgi:hypothetical protein